MEILDHEKIRKFCWAKKALPYLENITGVGLGLTRARSQQEKELCICATDRYSCLGKCQISMTTFDLESNAKLGITEQDQIPGLKFKDELPRTSTQKNKFKISSLKYPCCLPTNTINKSSKSNLCPISAKKHSPSKQKKKSEKPVTRQHVLLNIQDVAIPIFSR